MFLNLCDCTKNAQQRSQRKTNCKISSQCRSSSNEWDNSGEGGRHAQKALTLAINLQSSKQSIHNLHSSMLRTPKFNSCHEMQHKDSFANWHCLKRIAAMWQSLQNYVKGLTLPPMLRVNVAERALNDRSFKRSWSQSRSLWASSPSSRHLAWVEVRSAVYAGNGLTLPRQALEHGIRHGTTPRTDSLLKWSLLRLAMDNFMEP